MVATSPSYAQAMGKTWSDEFPQGTGSSEEHWYDARKVIAALYGDIQGQKSLEHGFRNSDSGKA